MTGASARYCSSCGAGLNVEINREFVFCSYCGTKNVIHAEAMKTNISVGGVNIAAKTDIDSILSTAKHAIDMKEFDKANEFLSTAIISGGNDYRVYVLMAMLALHKDDGRALFTALENLMSLERTHNSPEITNAIIDLMQYRGFNGVAALHNATFHERYDMVEFCVVHRSDVNMVAGMNRVTPISIMFVPISPTQSKIDGTPFIRNKEMVKKIRQYLLQHGAVDKWRMGY